MIPFFAVYRKQAIPYYAALLSHILIGDFFTGGIELLWPVSQNWFGTLTPIVNSLPVEITELTLFAVTLPIMYKLKDLQSLFKAHNKNWVLIIPLGAVLGPLFSLGRGGEGAVSSLLVIPSLFYVFLFAYSIFIDLRAKSNHYSNKMGAVNQILQFKKDQ